MQSKDGLDYTQNYDVIVKWLGEVLQGETLDVIGVKTGRIESVFGFEPVDIAVKSGRVDIMVRDETGVLYHIEEQRNLRKSDMYRFAAYHFMAAKKWGVHITDIILASGDVYPGEKRIQTDSGRYSPTVIDFSSLDAEKRLDEIHDAIRDGNFDNELELIFLPLYGKETGRRRSEIVEHVLHLGVQWYHENRISAKLLAAVLIMSNKLIEKDRLKQIWEEIKMLDILEIAKEEGIEEGKVIGIEEGKVIGIEEGKSLGIQEGKHLGLIEGKLENLHEMLMDALIERFRIMPPGISGKIFGINDIGVLKSLFRQSFKCDDIREFENILDGLRFSPD